MLQKSIDSTELYWQTTRFRLSLQQPKIMGIVNLTPDSFSDGGNYIEPKLALQRCELLLQQGADILDLGAESSRPNSAPVSLEQELQRLVPLVTEAVKLGVPISIDTYKAEVMQRMLDLGVDIINDIWALRQPGAIQVIARHPSCAVCLMHMHKEPQTMQQQPMQGDVLPQVIDFLSASAQQLRQQGVSAERIVLDAGIGFGKTAAQNLQLLAQQTQLNSLPYPWLVGWSRKSTLGAVTGLALEQRMLPSVAAALLAVERGAKIVRVHDVLETKQALQFWQAVNGSVSADLA